jgi:class 3 adenylate cyclase
MTLKCATVDACGAALAIHRRYALAGSLLEARPGHVSAAQEVRDRVGEWDELEQHRERVLDGRVRRPRLLLVFGRELHC